MADDTTTPLPSGRTEAPGRGHRQGGARDAGGFRIRLSDNEMHGARALQEAFGLRSTVAVLGFALRTLAQQLEQGQLDELIAQHRAQAGARPGGPRDGGQRDGGERRRERGERGERGEGRDGARAHASRGPRIDPFARPSRPAPAAPAVEEPSPAEADADAPTAADEEAAVSVAAEAASGDAADDSVSSEA